MENITVNMDNCQRNRIRIGGREMEVQELVEKTGWSRKKFADYFGIPYRTMQNWTLGIRKAPKYLVDLMEYKLEKEEKFERG